MTVAANWIYDILSFPPPRFIPAVTFQFIFSLPGARVCSLALRPCSLGAQGRPQTLTMSYIVLNPPDSCARHFPTRLSALQTNATATERNACSIKPPDTRPPTCETAERNQVVQLAANTAGSHVRVLALSRSLFSCHTPPFPPRGYICFHVPDCLQKQGLAETSVTYFENWKHPRKPRSAILTDSALPGAQRGLFQVLVIVKVYENLTK